MSGLFSRLKYDECYLNEDTKQSLKPGDYKLYTGQNENNNSCHSLFGPRNNRTKNSSEVKKGSDFGDRSDIETILTNRDVPTSRCQKNRKIEDKKNKTSTNLENSVYCDNFLNPTSTRLQEPIYNYKELTTYDNQISYPLIEPINNVFYGNNTTKLPNQNMNSRYGINTRLEAKYEYSNKFK